MAITLCPCGSTKSYAKCCKPFITGKSFPPTPEALMRSRYTAFTQADMDYIQSTMQGVVAEDFDAQSAKAWASHAVWQGLEIVEASPITEKSDHGFVEFIARFRLKDQDQKIHEISEFKHDADRWYYIDGQDVAPATIVRTEPKIGRNDPCVCGSGKKYKKCCYA